MGRQPEFLTELDTRELIGSQYAMLLLPFRYYSAVLGREIEVPPKFVCDYESVPLLKGSSKRAGVLHDYLSRTDSDPVVGKQTAADVYFEAQALRDRLMGYGWVKWCWRAFLRGFKTSVVRVWPGYWHRLPVGATFEEVSKSSADKTVIMARK